MVYPYLAVFGRGLGVGIPAISIALTARSLVGIIGPFFASIADSHGRKKGMLLGVALFTAGVGCVLVRPTFPAFILALILTALGKYIFDPTMQAFLGDRVPYQRRGRVLAVTEFGWSLSFIIGVPLIGLLVARGGWNAPFSLLTILGLLALGSLAWSVPNDSIQVRDRLKMWVNFRTILTSKPAMAALLVGLTASTANEIVNLIFGVWMEDAFALKIAALGAASAVIGLSELGGESLSIGLTDRLGKLRSVRVGLILNSLVAIILPLIGRNLVGALLGLFLFYITFEFALVSSIPMMTEILPQARATLMGANVASFSLGRALGAILAYPLYALGKMPGTILVSLPGITVSSLAAVAFNIFALLALRRLQKELKKKGPFVSDL